MKARTVLVGLLASSGLFVMLNACNPTNPTNPPPPAPVPPPTGNACPATIAAPSTVFAYSNPSCTAKVGASVTIESSSTHPLTLVGTWPSAVADQTKPQTFTFTTAGTYKYYCKFHGNQTSGGDVTGMSGTITVTN